MEKRLMNVVAPHLANREPAVLGKPGQCALHNPPVSPQLLAAHYALSCYTTLYPASSQGSLALFVVVCFVGMQLLRTFPRPTPTGTLDELYSIDGSLTDAVEIFQCVEELSWCSLSPVIGYQTHRFWGVSGPICGRFQLSADFFNKP
jgi:hypothetical protein